MVPKIADFGISKFLEGVTHATTSNLAVSLGYCPPEFLRFGKVSLKTDVYSLGVIIIEIVTGYREDPSIKNILRRWRYRWNKSGNYRPIAEEQIQKCINVAARCMAENPKRRPYIWNIVDDLREVEPTIGHINFRSAHDSTASQISPCPMEMLGIEPLEPHFPFEPNKQRTCSLELTNERDDTIGFRIDTSGPRRYHVKPNKGVVPPRSKCTVCITVQAHEKTPQGTLCKDEFVVWSTSVDDGLAAEDIIEGMFDEEGGKEVDEVNLSVFFDPPPFT
nr:cysteine-rich receptor-like protein kinase 19 [Lolium perenne]